MQFGTLKSSIQSDLNDLSQRTEDRIRQYINDGIMSICSYRRWAFLKIEKSDEMTLTSADTPLLFDNIKKDGSLFPAKFITNVFDTTTGTNIKLDKINFESLSEQNSILSGYPLYWFEQHDSLGKKYIDFFPYLTTSPRKFIFSYIRKVVEITSDATEIPIPDAYTYVLRAYVDWRVLRYKSDDRVAECFGEYQQGLKNMVRDISIYSNTSNENRIVDRFHNGVVVS